MAVDIVEIAGHQMVFMPLAHYDRLVRLAEGITEFIEDVDKSRASRKSGKMSRADALNRINKGENRLKVWRIYRGLTQTQLGNAIGLHKVTISKYEAGKLGGSGKLWRDLAKALAVEVDDIFPES